MNGKMSRMSARRLAAVASAVALAAGPAVLAGAAPAHASGDEGKASAVVLRTGLDVSLLNKAVHVPLTVSLNEVQAPQSADRTALTAQLDGVNQGRPFSVLKADVASAKADVTDARAEAATKLVNARVHVPGLPLLSVIELGTVSAEAVCEADAAPRADANVLGGVTVLGKKVTLSAGGPTIVKVPGVGEVRLDLSKKETTSRTAAATALELKVSVNPLKLNVAEVEGTLTLVEATCEAPAATAAPAEPSAPAEAPEEAGPGTKEEPDGSAGSGGSEEANQVRTQGSRTEANLAETGGSSMTPYIAGGALALVLAGGGAVALARRGRS